jgi:diacylglycerol kinase (ATP)
LKGASDKTVFIVNPNASMGSTGREWPTIAQLARDRLGPFQVFITSRPGDATSFARSSLLNGAEMVVCVGGDGTLNEVINGFMIDGEAVRTKSILGFIPRGTGCDFIRTTCIPRDVGGALDLIAGRGARPIDIGRLEYIDHQGRRCNKYFHNVTSFGLGGEVNERVNGSTKVFGGFISFLWATLISLLIYNKKRIHINVDNGKSRDIICWNIAVANGQYHGGGMWVAPGARVDDGFFNVTLVGNLNLAEVFWNLPKLYNGRIFQVKNVSGLSGRRIEAYSEQRVLLDMDGEQPGQLPVVIEIIPDALSLIRP